MEKLQRNERIALLTKILSDQPGKIFTLGTFIEMFGCAKSTMSEDIDIIKNTFCRFDWGKVETIAGASGGVRFIPVLSEDKTQEILETLCGELSLKDRLLPGGYIYMLDIIYDPVKMSLASRIFARQFFKYAIDYVVTVETKGIPLAYSTAKQLGVPLVIVRHLNEATDGASVNINYISGSSNKIQTMVLSLKALKKKSKILFIDDFMKGGGTAKGIIELTKEFECKVAGIGVLIETKEPQKKLVNEYFSLLTLNNIGDNSGIIDIKPTKMKHPV